MDTPETVEELEARVAQAYAAYSEALGGVDNMHRPLEPYADMHDIFKGAWRAAVRAALAPEAPAQVEPHGGTPQTHPADQAPAPKVDEATLPPAHPPGQTPTPTHAEAARQEPEHQPTSGSRRTGTAPAVEDEDDDPPRTRGRK